MAKRKGKGRRRFNLRRVRVNAASAAGALATLDVVSNAIINASANPYRLKSVDCSYSWSNIGAAVDDGCAFGFAHSDYTAAEIEECLESITAIDRSDKIAQEQANRLVREIGTIAGVGTSVAATGVPFNQGMAVKTKLNWYMGIGDQLQLWIRNASGTVWTTGSSVTMSGNIWVQDSV